MFPIDFVFIFPMNVSILHITVNATSPKYKNLSVQKPFHEAIGCALEAVRVTLEKTLSTVSIEKDNIKKEDIELNQVAARREIMNSENADWTRFVKLIK